MARVLIWSVAHTTPYASKCRTRDVGSGLPALAKERKAHLSSFDVRSGGVPPLHSAEFRCPPSQLLRAFEFLVRAEMKGRDENKDRCAADVWRGVERGANEGLCGQQVPVGFCR